MAQLDTSFDLREYWAIAKRRALLWVLPLLLVSGAAFGISYLLTPRYQASTIVLIDDPVTLSGAIQRIVPQTDASRLDRFARAREAALIENEIKGSRILIMLIGSLDLDADPEVQKEVGKLLKQRPGAHVGRLTMQYLVGELREDVQVSVFNGNIVQIKVDHRDPALAARMADKLGELFMDQRRAQELSGVRSALDFTDEQLEVYRQKQADAEERLRQFQEQSLSTRFDEALLSPSNLDEILGELDASHYDLARLKETQQGLQDRIESFGTDPAKWSPSRNVQRLEQNLMLQISDYVRLLGRYTWEDPTVVALNTRLAEGLDEIELGIDEQVTESFAGDNESLRRLWSEFYFQQIRESFLSKKIDVLEQSIQQLKARNAKGPDYAITMQNLKNEVEYDRQIYQSFLDQLTGTQIQQALQQAETESRFRVLESAYVPFKPFYPNRLRITLIGLVLGLLIGAALVIGFELADHSFRSPEQVEEYLGVTVLGSLPRMAGGKVRV